MLRTPFERGLLAAVNSQVADYYLGKITIHEAIERAYEICEEIINSEKFKKELEAYYESFIPVQDIANESLETITIGDFKPQPKCNRCVYELGCTKENRLNCPDYKRDPPDGGYYG